MKKLNDVADILIELVARGGGNETLDPLYDLIADHPGSTNFTAEQGRDALLVAVARVVQMLAEGRQHRPGASAGTARAHDHARPTTRCGGCPATRPGQ